MDGISNKGTSISETDRQHNQNTRKITTKKMDRNYAKKMERGAAMTSKKKDFTSNNQNSMSSIEGRKHKAENRHHEKTPHDQGSKSALLNTKDKSSPSKQLNRDHLSKNGHLHTGNVNGSKGSGKKKNADRKVVGKLVNANLREAETTGVVKENPVPTSPKKNAKSWASETIVKEPSKNQNPVEKDIKAPPVAVPLDFKASPSHANLEPDAKIEHESSQMEKQLLKSTEEQEADLERTYIFRLGKKSMKFPRAVYYCRLCNYHIDTLSQCWIHIDQSRHERLAKAKESANFFKNLPRPSRAHARALTKLLEDVVEEHAMTGREMNARKEVARRVESILHGLLPDCRVKLYGSSLSSFGFHDSDVNLDVEVPNEKQASKVLMAASQAIAERVGKDLTEFEADFEGKHPCVRFRDKRTGYICELGTANQHAVQSSQLMVEYNECDARLRPLVIGLRHWARICGIDQQALGAMPAHTFVLLVIYFLQQCHPPILPILQQNEKLKTENQRTLGELWVELLKFYLVGINIEELVISIRQREPLYRADLKIPNRRIAVEDPFANGKKTVAKSLTTASVFKYIMDRFHDALKYFGIPPSKRTEMGEEGHDPESENDVTSVDGSLKDDDVHVDSTGDDVCETGEIAEEMEQSNKDQDEHQGKSIEEVFRTEQSTDDRSSVHSSEELKENEIKDGGDQFQTESRGEEEDKTGNPGAEQSLTESNEEQDRTEPLDGTGHLGDASTGKDGSEKSAGNEQLVDPEAKLGAMLAEVAITEAESEESKQVDSAAESLTECPRIAETDSQPVDEGVSGKGALVEDTESRDIVSASTAPELDQSESSPTKKQTTVFPSDSFPTAGSLQNDGLDGNQGVLRDKGNAELQTPTTKENISSEQCDSRPAGPSESDSSPSVVQSEKGDNSSLSSADKIVNETDSEADVPCHSRLFDAIHMEEVEEINEDEEMNDGDQEDLVFTFDKEILTRGEEVQFVCTSCLKEGHINKYCPEDTLPPLQDLPPMDPAFLELSSIFCDQIFKRNYPNQMEVRDREQCVRELEYYIRQYAFREAQLSLFGSSGNGFGFRNSDLDICLTFRTAKTSKDVDVASVVEQLAMALKRNRSLYNIVPIPTAKVPIVKFVHRPTGLEGDISLYNTLAQRNTHLLYTYSQIDERVKMLGYSMKFLAKLCDIGDASRGSLSSYAYTLLTVFFLQQRDPPVLPVLQELYSGDKQPVFEVDGCNAWFFGDLRQLHRFWRGQNNESVGALWLGMLRFYTEEFDFTKYVVSIRRKILLTRFEKLWMTPQRGFAIEDPFDLDHNLGGAASKKMAIYIVQVFRHARDVFGTPCRFFRGRRPTTDEIMRYFTDLDALTGGEAPPNDRGCRICGKIGHFVKDCPVKRRGQDRKENERRERERERESRERSLPKDSDALTGSPGAQRTMHQAESPLARGKHPMDSPQRPGMHTSESSPQLRAKQLAEATNKRGRNLGDLPHAESSPELRGKQLGDAPSQSGIAIPGSSPEQSGKYQTGSPQQRGLGHLESSPQVTGKQLVESQSQRGNHLPESPQRRGMGHTESPHLIRSKNATDSPNQMGKHPSDPPHGGSTCQPEVSVNPKGKPQELPHQRGMHPPESPQARGKGDKSTTGGVHSSESSPHPKEKRIEEKQKDSPKTKPSETKHKNAPNDLGKSKKLSGKSNEPKSKTVTDSTQGAEKPARNVARQLYPAKPVPVPLAKDEVDSENGAPATTAPPAGQMEKGAKKNSLYEQQSQQQHREQEQKIAALFQIVGKTPPRGPSSHSQASPQGPMLRPPTIPSNAHTLDEIEQQLKTKERQQTRGPLKLPPGAKSVEQLEQQYRQDEFFKAREHQQQQQQQQQQQGHSPQNQQQQRQTGSQGPPYQKGNHEQESQQHQVLSQQYNLQDSSQFQADRAIRPPQQIGYSSGGLDGQYLQGEPLIQQQQRFQNQSHPIPITSQRRPSNERHLHQQQQQQQQLSHHGWGSPLQTTPPSPHGMDHRQPGAFASPPRRQRWASGGITMPHGNVGPSPPHNLLQSPPGPSTPPLLSQFGHSPFGPDMIVDPRQSSHEMRSPPHHNFSHRPVVAGNVMSIWGQQQEAGQNPWPQQINPDQNRQHQPQQDSWPQHIGQQNRNQQQQQVQHGEPQTALDNSPRSPPMDPGSIIPEEAQRQFQNVFGQGQNNSQTFHYSQIGLNPNLPRSNYLSQSPLHNLQGQGLHQQQQQHLSPHPNQQQQQQLHHHHPYHQYNHGEPQWQQQKELQQHIGFNMSSTLTTSSAVGGPIMSTTLSQQSRESGGSRNHPMPR